MHDFGPGPGQFIERTARDTCPGWCAISHGVHMGEEDWLHRSNPISLDDGTFANLCMSINPATGAQDGPFIVIGATEYSLEQAEHIGAALMAMAHLGTSHITAAGA